MNYAESLQKLLELTTKMLALAERLDLDGLTAIQGERTELLQQIKTLSPINSGDTRQQIEKILTLEQQIAEIVQPWHAQMAQFISASAARTP